MGSSKKQKSKLLTNRVIQKSQIRKIKNFYKRQKTNNPELWKKIKKFYFLIEQLEKKEITITEFRKKWSLYLKDFDITSFNLLYCMLLEDCAVIYNTYLTIKDYV